MKICILHCKQRLTYYCLSSITKIFMIISPTPMAMHIITTADMPARKAIYFTSCCIKNSALQHIKWNLLTLYCNKIESCTYCIRIYIMVLKLTIVATSQDIEPITYCDLWLLHYLWTWVAGCVIYDQCKEGQWSQ